MGLQRRPHSYTKLSLVLMLPTHAPAVDSVRLGRLSRRQARNCFDYECRLCAVNISISLSDLVSGIRIWDCGACLCAQVEVLTTDLEFGLCYLALRDYGTALGYFKKACAASEIHVEDLSLLNLVRVAINRLYREDEESVRLVLNEFLELYRSLELSLPAACPQNQSTVKPAVTASQASIGLCGLNQRTVVDGVDESNVQAIPPRSPPPSFLPPTLSFQLNLAPICEGEEKARKCGVTGEGYLRCLGSTTKAGAARRGRYLAESSSEGCSGGSSCGSESCLTRPFKRKDCGELSRSSFQKNNEDDEWMYVTFSPELSPTPRGVGTQFLSSVDPRTLSPPPFALEEEAQTVGVQLTSPVQALSYPRSSSRLVPSLSLAALGGARARAHCNGEVKPRIAADSPGSSSLQPSSASASPVVRCFLRSTASDCSAVGEGGGDLRGVECARCLGAVPAPLVPGPRTVASSLTPEREAPSCGAPVKPMRMHDIALARTCAGASIARVPAAAAARDSAAVGGVVAASGMDSTAPSVCRGHTQCSLVGGVCTAASHPQYGGRRDEGGRSKSPPPPRAPRRWLELEPLHRPRTSSVDTNSGRRGEGGGGGGAITSGDTAGQIGSEHGSAGDAPNGGAVVSCGEPGSGGEEFFYSWAPRLRPRRQKSRRCPAVRFDDLGGSEGLSGFKSSFDVIFRVAAGASSPARLLLSHWYELLLLALLCTCLLLDATRLPGITSAHQTAAHLSIPAFDALASNLESAAIPAVSLEIGAEPPTGLQLDVSSTAAAALLVRTAVDGPSSLPSLGGLVLADTIKRADGRALCFTVSSSLGCASLRVSRSLLPMLRPRPLDPASAASYRACAAIQRSDPLSSLPTPVFGSSMLGAEALAAPAVVILIEGRVKANLLLAGAASASGFAIHSDFVVTPIERVTKEISSSAICSLPWPDFLFGYDLSQKQVCPRPLFNDNKVIIKTALETDVLVPPQVEISLAPNGRIVINTRARGLVSARATVRDHERRLMRRREERAAQVPPAVHRTLTPKQSIPLPSGYALDRASTACIPRLQQRVASAYAAKRSALPIWTKFGRTGVVQLDRAKDMVASVDGGMQRSRGRPWAEKLNRLKLENISHSRRKGGKTRRFMGDASNGGWEESACSSHRSPAKSGFGLPQAQRCASNVGYRAVLQSAAVPRHGGAVPRRVAQSQAPLASDALPASAAGAAAGSSTTGSFMTVSAKREFMLEEVVLRVLWSASSVLSSTVSEAADLSARVATTFDETLSGAREWATYSADAFSLGLTSAYSKFGPLTLGLYPAFFAEKIGRMIDIASESAFIGFYATTSALDCFAGKIMAHSLGA